MPERDDALLDAVRHALEAADPVPDELHAGAIAAFAFHNLDGALAGIAALTPAGVRNDTEDLVVFEAEHAEVAITPGEGRLVGQIAPPASCPCALEAPGADPVRFTADELGRFAVDAPSGPVRLVIEHPAGLLRTDWFRT